MNLFDLIIVQPIFNLLEIIYSLIPGGDFGIALIIFTVLVRLAMWPLVKKQLHQTKIMQKIQPELKKIKVKAHGNKQLEGVMMMDLYKEYGISPFGSMGIILIQFPILIALYRVVRIFTVTRTDVAKYTYGIVTHIPAIGALVHNPNILNEKFLGIVDLSQQAISSKGISIALLVVVIISAVTQYISTKQMSTNQQDTKKIRDIMKEASSGKEPDQAEMNAAMMNNMMKITPIMTFVIMVGLPGALSFYYGISNIMAVLQQHLILNKDEGELFDLASKDKKEKNNKKENQYKKATERARKASEGTVIRIVANDKDKKQKG